MARIGWPALRGRRGATAADAGRSSSLLARERRRAVRSPSRRRAAICLTTRDANSASPRSFTPCAATAIRASATSRRSRSSRALGAKVGAALIAINPLHALFAQDRTRVSPYYPSDRRFLDPLYIDLAELRRMLGAPIDFDENDRGGSQRRRGCRLSRRAGAEDGGARDAPSQSSVISRAASLTPRPPPRSRASSTRAGRRSRASASSRRSARRAMAKAGGCGRRSCATRALRR